MNFPISTLGQFRAALQSVPGNTPLLIHDHRNAFSIGPLSVNGCGIPAEYGPALGRWASDLTAVWGPSPEEHVLLFLMATDFVTAEMQLRLLSALSMAGDAPLLVEHEDDSALPAVAMGGRFTPVQHPDLPLIPFWGLDDNGTNCIVIAPAFAPYRMRNWLTHPL